VSEAARTPARPARSDTGRATLWMLGAIVSFSAMAIAGRELSAELDTFEIMAYRSAIGVPVIAAVVMMTGGPAQLLTRHPGRHVVRNVIHFTAQNAWFFGIATIPLAQLVAIEFTNPIWIALFAPLILGERLTRAGKIAVGLGFLGVLIVARPGVSPLEFGHGAALVAAIGFALTNIVTRLISREDTLPCVLFWMTLSQAAMGFACAAPGGITLFSWEMSPWVLFVGLCGLTAHFALTRALFLAPASVVAPMEFLRLPALATAGAILYGEPIELAVFLGAALIIAGNIVNIRDKERA